MDTYETNLVSINHGASVTVSVPLAHKLVHDRRHTVFLNGDGYGLLKMRVVGRSPLLP